MRAALEGRYSVVFRRGVGGVGGSIPLQLFSSRCLFIGGFFHVLTGDRSLALTTTPHQRLLDVLTPVLPVPRLGSRPRGGVNTEPVRRCFCLFFTCFFFDTQQHSFVVFFAVPKAR